MFPVQVYDNVQEMAQWNGPEENIYMDPSQEKTRDDEAEEPPTVKLPVCLRASAAAVALLSALLLAAVTAGGVFLLASNTRANEMKAQITKLTSERALLQNQDEAIETVNRNVSELMILLQLIQTRQREVFQQLQQHLTALSTETDHLRCTIDMMPCSKPWVRFRRSCYFLSLNLKNWTASRQDCEDQGASLVIINSSEEQMMPVTENTFISSLVYTSAWIGLSDMNTESEWRWVNGDGLTGTTFWSLNQPDNAGGDEDCGEIHTDHHWNDNKCSIAMHYVCEDDDK